ncbi:rod shape-determining protein MreD [Varunaivibrio sulfuroxidans]|uniref:Rod shape-determining protein MreD n=1 Tax=Varunaivibrio sulfuroxidans TaxID=1773489 RepID=A0A4R3J533_9PROT|nr:rod shape-determining protein MreD [Varunaivibrio sulfuroxidans]TCS60989.1 rod shape-determining protein MreD [Varunaivibrio sulfuroxidans]WES31605.1 rod shape-determining protein MreD [Varunaivibrio sulfuroxidans]
MRSTLFQRMDAMLRRLTPFALAVLTVILNVIPVRIPGLPEVAPVLPIMAIYHWTIYRPQLLPVYAVFALGVLQDALVGLPMGVSVLVFLMVHIMVLSQQVFFTGKSFAIHWLGFALVAAGTQLMFWVVMSLYYTSLIGVWPMVFQYLLTVGFFPLVAWLLLRWQRSVLAMV